MGFAALYPSYEFIVARMSQAISGVTVLIPDVASLIRATCWLDEQSREVTASWRSSLYIKSEAKMNDVLGWQDTRWGMTTQDIISAVSTEHIKAIRRSDGPKDTWFAELIIPNLRIGSYDFDWNFKCQNLTTFYRRY